MGEIIAWIIAGLGVVSLVFFVASLDRNASPSDEKFNTICLEGVEYWYRQSGYKGMLAAKLDTAGNIVLCEAE